MGRIKIEDLPKDMEISKKDMKRITGGIRIQTLLNAEMIRLYNLPPYPWTQSGSSDESNG